MEGKLKQVLLIDDSVADNYLHRMVIEDTGLVEDIVDFQYAEKALEYLRNGDAPPVDLIFLDINMPRMNGFEFLEEYAKLPEERKAGMVVTMLTTSLNPEDEESARRCGLVKAYLTKPLMEETFAELMRDCFGAKV
ncbi:MAG: response regulator [Verrucomicrobiales bacterium]|nr:response regulator [Verrucomicrobiales bacterium]